MSPEPELQLATITDVDEPQRQEAYFRTCALSEDSDQSVLIVIYLNKSSFVLVKTNQPKKKKKKKKKKNTHAHHTHTKHFMLRLKYRIINTFIPELLKWILPSLNLVRSIVPNRSFLVKNKNRMANSADPDESRLIRIYAVCTKCVLFCRAERVKRVVINVAWARLSSFDTLDSCIVI